MCTSHYYHVVSKKIFRLVFLNFIRIHYQYKIILETKYFPSGSELSVCRYSKTYFGFRGFEDLEIPACV